jgi:hypothetical protein
MRKNGLNPVERSPEVDVHGLLKVAVGHMLERTHLNNAGVIDQHVNPPEMLQHDVDRGSHVRGFGDVAHDRQNFSFARIQRHRRPLKFVFAPGKNRDARAFRAKPAGQQQPESARAAGNDYEAAGEVHPFS